MNIMHIGQLFMDRRIHPSVQIYTAIQRKVVGKKAKKCTRQDRKEVWVEV